jgi:CubicO group peptidase (beta-lactamase class C family)
MSYFPGPDGTEWRRLDPAEAGVDPVRLREAASLAETRETPWGRDIGAVLAAGFFEKPPHNEVLGPTRPRGAPNGLVLRHGAIVAEWGDTTRADMTFSVAKSYLSLLAGLAFDRGLIPDLDEPVARRVSDPAFAGPRHERITWRHLLQQTSEWEGTLFGKAELIDRNRDLAVEGQGSLKGTWREMHEPGTYWEYNDVRVNVLAYALLHVWRRPLPEVFRELVMEAIGASAGWEWHGYRTSDVTIDGRRVNSVSGGGHWGGGVFISARDQARIGLLMLRRGEWGGRRILSESWVRLSTEPCALKPGYGLMWWLNTAHARYKGASEASFFGVGAGGNLTWVDPKNDLVAVLRWTDPAAMGDFAGLVTQAIRPPG